MHARGWISLLAGILAVNASNASNASDASARQVDGGTATLSPEWLALGFSEPGVPIRQDGYAQLRVVAYIPEGSDGTTFDACPQKSVWDLNLKDVLKGDRVHLLGVSVAPPTSSGLPAFTAAPLRLETRNKFFGSSCTLNLRKFEYLSPRFHVGSNTHSRFQVVPAILTSTQVNVEAWDQAMQAIQTLTTYAELTAPLVTTQLAGLKGQLLQGMKTSVERPDEIFTISEGVTRKPKVWSFSGEQTRAGGAIEGLVVTVIAQLVPADDLVRRSLPDAPWLPATILKTQMNGTMGGESDLDGHIRRIASGEIVNLISERDSEAAAVRCDLLAEKIHGLRLSQHDAGLALWAYAHKRAEMKLATADEVVRMPCLQGFRHVLVKAGLLPENVPLVASPPTHQDMLAATQIQNALWQFFTRPAWQDRKSFAERLFAYPVGYGQRVEMLQSTATIDNKDAWVSNAHAGSNALAQSFGCPVFFPGRTDHPFLNWAGHSVMVAFATLPVAGGDPRDAVVALRFAQQLPGEAAKIDAVEVDPHPAAEVARSVAASLRASGGCVDHYAFAPALLQQ